MFFMYDKQYDMLNNLDNPSPLYLKPRSSSNLVVELKVSSVRVVLRDSWMTHQSHVVMNKHNILLIRRLDTFRIHDTSPRSTQVGSTTPMCSVDIIREWEESITGTTNALQFLHMFNFLLFGQFNRGLIEQTLPLSPFSSLSLVSCSSDE